MRTQMRSGYVGLIVVMVSVAIMAMLFVKIYFTPRAQESSVAAFQPNTASGTVPTTEYSRMHADIDAANAVKDQLNTQNAETARVLSGGE